MPNRYAGVLRERLHRHRVYGKQFPRLDAVQAQALIDLIEAGSEIVDATAHWEVVDEPRTRAAEALTTLDRWRSGMGRDQYKQSSR